MYRLCLYLLVATIILTESNGQDGSINQQSMFGNGFSVSHKSSRGKVNRMNTNGFSSLLTNANFKEIVRSKRIDDLDDSFMSNGNPSAFDFVGLDKELDFSDINIPNILANKPSYDDDRRRITFSDGTFIDLPGDRTKNSQSEAPSWPQQLFVNTSPVQSNPNPQGGSGNVVVVSGGNGADGADASQGGANGADGSIQVQAFGNGPPIVNQGIRRRRRHV